MKTPAINKYTVLVKNIRQELQELDFIIRQRSVETYWQIGKYIHTHLLGNKPRADYRTAFYIKLSNDVDRDVSTLQRAIQFYRTYPNSAVQRNLSWDHYKRLITVRDAQERKKLESKVIREDWNSTKLREYLSARRTPPVTVSLSVPGNGKPIPQLNFTRGQLNTCEVIELTHPKTKHVSLCLDPGFRLCRPFPENQSLHLKKGDCVEIRRTSSRYSFVKITVPTAQRFTYKAQLQKIIDGDTLWATIDTGLGMWIKQKLRLREIDCPEIDTAEGKRARRFVQDRLKGLEWIIVKTHKDTADKYDRYLADIFYLPGECNPQKIAQEGRFLNQELLDNRLATVYLKSSP